MKIITTCILSILSIQAIAEGCDLEVMKKKVTLQHVYAFERAKWMNAEKMDWVIFCLQDEVPEDKHTAEKISSGIGINDLYGVKIIMNPISKKITEVRLSWHENTIAMISGVLGNVQFSGQAENHVIKGMFKSQETLTAQKSQLVNDEMISENVGWGFTVQINQTVKKVGG